MICLILALILVLPTLASCKGEMPDGGETSLTESTAKPSVEDTSEQGGDSNAESETDTESDTVGGANVELEGEHADLISHSHHGFLVDVGDSKAIANYISSIADDSNLAYRLGNEAQSVYNRLSVDKISKQWIEILKNFE